MHPIIHQYKLRLTNLSQANRSLKLGRLSTRKDLDLMDCSFINKLSAADILQRIVAGKSVDLIRALSATDENTNLLDRRLNKIFREVSTLYEETGTDDLFLGYPFVEGKFLDGSIARCPVMLFPIALKRNLQGKPRWRLEVPRHEDVAFNKTFFLAFEKFQQVRFPKEFWEEQPEHQKDLQDLLNYLYQFFKTHELQLNFNSELFQFNLTHFEDKNKERLDQLEVGKLKLYPNAVLGVFPQSDSALLQDYQELEKSGADFELHRFLETQADHSPVPYIKEDQRYFVTPVDQSQEHSLLKVKSGHSVVLHGPPGTGKSQVILNLIADGLAQGKRILVCSQKRAALDVVYHRMSEIGLNRFAALVHDYRGDRNKIFQHIRRQIDGIEAFQAEGRDLNQEKWIRDFRQDSRRIDELNHYFDDLHKGLTDSTRFGASIHELYLRAYEMEQVLPLFEQAARLDVDALRSLMQKFRELLDYLEFFEEGYSWRYRQSLATVGYEQRNKFLKNLEGLDSQLEALHAARARFRLAGEDVSSPEKVQEVTQAFRRIEQMLNVPGVRADFAAFEGQQVKMDFARRKLESLGKIFLQMKKFELLDDFPMSLMMDLRMHFGVYAKMRDRFGRMFSLKYLKARWYLKAIVKKKGRKLKEPEFKRIRDELKVLERLLKHWEDLENLLFFSDLPLTDSPEKMLEWHTQKLSRLDAIRAIRAEKVPPVLKPKWKATDFDKASWAESTAVIGEMEAYVAAHEGLRSKWKNWLHPAQIAVLEEGKDDLEKGKAVAKTLQEAFRSDFQDLKSLDELIAGFTAAEREVFDVLEKDLDELKVADKDAFLEKMENSILLAWIEMLEKEHPVLSDVSGRGMWRRRQDYRTKVRERQEKVVQLILRKLKAEIVDNIEYNRLKNPVTYRDIGHQVKKQRRLWSVRKLVREYWDEGLSRLMPCWLASPESVAAIFPMEKGFFDLVIFDEASQCYVERALPVMLRGHHAVIAGDDKQLPPFDLYNVKVDEAEGAFFEDEMALEVESVLDLAKNIFAEVKLNWHYRSQEEELINFSNFAFYDGRLNIIPPAHHDPFNMPPLQWIPVAGRWDKNRNQAEAERVIGLVEELVQRPDQPTIGIVTFNYFQKELIRDLLEQRIEALGTTASLGAPGDEKLLRLLTQAMEREEGEERQGIFVKNIENVQGDERDIIIFSIGYARNEKGKLVTNFGLLNQKGGENRLNVAITRARKKIYVLCSFQPTDLKVENAKHQGPRMFKRYLQYAEAISSGKTAYAEELLRGMNGGVDAEEPGFSPENSNLLREKVREGLEAAGYIVREGVGDTNYQLDLAVMDGEGEYVLGIECEGSQYFNGKSSKEREVYRLNLLEQRGWTVVRVWARNYFLDPKGTIQQIIAQADKALKSLD